MKKKDYSAPSRAITGIILIALGFFMTLEGLLRDFGFLIYGIPPLLIGIFIIFNKSEDSVEEIKGRENNLEK